MDQLFQLLYVPDDLGATIVKVVIFIAIGEFIGAIFSLIGKMKG